MRTMTLEGVQKLCPLTERTIEDLYLPCRPERLLREFAANGESYSADGVHCESRGFTAMDGRGFVENTGVWACIAPASSEGTKA